MTDREKISTSKFLSLILRHKPEKVGVSLDANGWVDVEVLIGAMNKHGRITVTLDDIKDVVITNDKQRVAFNDDYTKIRANQGNKEVLKIMNEKTQQYTKEQLSNEAFRKFRRDYTSTRMSYNTLNYIAKNDLEIKRYFEVTTIEELNKFNLPYKTNEVFYDTILNALEAAYKKAEQKMIVVYEILYKQSISGINAISIYALQKSELMVERIMECDDEVLHSLHENSNKDEAKQRLMEILGLDNEALRALNDFSFALWCDAFNWQEKGDTWREKAKGTGQLVPEST